MQSERFNDLMASLREAEDILLRRLAGLQLETPLARNMRRVEAMVSKPAPVDDNWMRVAPGTDAAIWRPWSRETGEL